VIRWLENNPAGQVLAGFAGLLLLVMLAIGIIWSRPPSGGSEGQETGEDSLEISVPQLAEGQPIEAYAVVTERPVFNESRQPELEADVGQEGMDELAETEVDAPELELAGVVITPNLRMVTLRQKDAKESLVAFEGQPLEGSYGSWHVSRIGARDITLASGSGEEIELELQVHDAEIKPPPKPEPKAEVAAAESGQRAAEEGGDEDAPMTRAEEIRQRIQERREELRRAAEAAQENGQEQQMDYQTAIQSMISGRKKQTDDEDDR
jgi:hypothetical protein